MRINDGEFEARVFPGRYTLARYRLDGQHVPLQDVEVKPAVTTEAKLVVPAE